MAALLLVSAAGLAAPWIAAQGEHVIVLGRDAERAAALVTAADEVLARVWAYWLPLGASNNAPAWLRPPRSVLMVYDDPNAYWEDTDLYGSSGVFVPPELDLWNTVVAPALAAAGLRDRVPAILCYYVPEGLQATLAHEATHLLQFSPPKPPKTWFPAPWVRDLYLEGMAVWTEYALGYGGDFALEVTQPVLVWLSRGGKFVEEIKNRALFYAIGASIVSAELRELSPPQVLALVSPAVADMIGLPRKPSFAGLFAAEHGLTWIGFFSKWKLSLTLWETSTPAGELVYEFYRRNVVLREAFLWPLLSRERVNEIADLGERILEGKADEGTLLRLESLLGDVTADPSPAIMEAIRKRRDALTRWARWFWGDEGAAEIAGLFAREEKGAITQEEFLKSYVGLVNRLLVPPS